MNSRVIFYPDRLDPAWWYVVQIAPRGKYIFEDRNVDQPMQHLSEEDECPVDEMESTAAHVLDQETRPVERTEIDELDDRDNEVELNDRENEVDLDDRDNEVELDELWIDLHLDVHVAADLARDVCVGDADILNP